MAPDLRRRPDDTVSIDPHNTHEQYARHIKQWGKFLATVSRKLHRELERRGIKFTLRHRIKTVESLLEKKMVYGPVTDGGGEAVKDLLGLRVTVPFLEDVDTVVDAIQDVFKVHEIERKAEKLSYREFAYDSVHMIVVDPAADIEFPLGCLRSCCEIQVRTILQDAWAEVEHELVYKSRVEFPDSTIRKKLAALNASLTLSDIIFQEIRDRQQELRRWGSERFHELERKAASLSPAELSIVMRFDPARDLPADAKASATDTGLLERTVKEALEAHGAKNYGGAIRRYEKALDMQPPLSLRAAIYNYRGLAHFMLHEERAALSDFESSVACDARYYPALNNCALVWRRFGHLRKSLDEFDRSLAIESNQPEVHLMRSQTLLEAGEPRAALQAARSALAIDPAYADAETLARKAEQLLDSSRS
jgi:putative GTP pyrophosphokinase